MTTLSKEDIDLAAEKFDYSDFSGEFRTSADGLHAFADHIATLARADLVAENERLKAELSKHEAVPQYKEARRAEVAVLREQLTATRTALAAAEAENERLRDDFKCAANYVDFLGGDSKNYRQTISQPRDDSTLREMLAEVYEECAKVPDNVPIRVGNAGIWGIDVKNAIRALAEKARHGS